MEYLLLVLVLVGLAIGFRHYLYVVVAIAGIAALCFVFLSVPILAAMVAGLFLFGVFVHRLFTRRSGAGT